MKPIRSLDDLVESLVKDPTRTLAVAVGQDPDTILAVANAIEIEKPKAAMVSATETISFKVQSSVDAAVVTAMSQRKQIQGVVVDGPLSLDVALSKERCVIKDDSKFNYPGCRTAFKTFPELT